MITAVECTQIKNVQFQLFQSYIVQWTQSNPETTTTKSTQMGLPKAKTSSSKQVFLGVCVLMNEGCF